MCQTKGEKLDLALDSLRKQKIEDGETGRWYCMIAECYIGPAPPLCPWDRIPGEHICAKCGKAFGDPEKKEGDMRFRINEDDCDMIVEEYDIRDILKVYKTCKRTGYDVELDLYCSECVKKYDLELAAFRFRAPDENDEVVSFPILLWFHSEEKQSSDKHFYPWQYKVVAEFLTRSVKETTDRKDMWRRWTNRITETTYECESDPWKPLEEIVKGILGLSFCGSTDDTPDEIVD